jgi:hypothetical protein
MNRAYRLLMVGVLLALGSVTLWAQSDVSVAEAARQNRKAKARKVITDEDLPKTNGVANGAASQPAPVSSSSNAKPALPSADDKPADAPAPADNATAPNNDKQPDQLAMLRKDHAALLDIIGKYKAKIDAEPNEDSKATLFELLRRAQDRLDENEKQIQQLEKEKAAGGSGSTKPQS